MTNIKPDNGMDPAVEGLEVVGEVRAKSDAYGGGTFVLWKQLPVVGMKLVDLASAQAAVAALEETVRQLNHALRDATEAPTFMGEPTTNELVAPLVRSQYQHKRAQERITQLEAALVVAREALQGASSAVAKAYGIDDYQEHVEAIAAIDSVGVTKT